MNFLPAMHAAGLDDQKLAAVKCTGMSAIPTHRERNALGSSPSKFPKRIGPRAVAQGQDTFKPKTVAYLGAHPILRRNLRVVA